MIKVIVAIPKRADITDAQFHAHWREPHGRLALNIKPMRRYVQAHRIAYPALGLPCGPYAGFAEVWLDDVPAALGLGSDPDYLRYLRPDEPNFCDQAGLKFLFTKEDIARAGPADGGAAPLFKLMQLVRRRPGLSEAVFQGEWGRGPAEVQAAAALDLERHIRCRSVPETATGMAPAFDAVREMGWRDAAAFEQARTRSPGAWRAMIFAPAVDPDSVTVVALSEERFL